MIHSDEELKEALDSIREYTSEPSKGLPEELFLFVSEMSPLTNVDLLIRDEGKRVLLAWRNDPWWGSGWHVPGGVIRVNETIKDRIQRTALAEIGTEVFHKDSPIEVRQIIESSFRSRSHHITLVYDCGVSYDYKINNRFLKQHDTGYLSWHEQYPEDMLRCHEFYRKYFN